MMRLSEPQRDTVILLTECFFGEGSHLWLFGSRVDDKKRGGDFDFYIETPIADAKVLFKERLQFLQALHDTSAFTDEKIDLVVHSPLLGPRLPIATIATEEGIRLL